MSRFTRISRVDVTGSTNQDMAAILGEERSRGLTIVADYQERGSGRKGRSWIAPPGSALLCTIGLPDPMPASQLWVVPFWIALAVRAAVRRYVDDVTLQWPNDVLAGRRKLAGILCVSRVTGNAAWVGCGIGLNVRRPDDETSLREIQPPPAFLSDFADADRAAVLEAILKEADTRYGELADPIAVAAEWEVAAELPGARYRIALDAEDGAFDARALRLLPGGALLVESGGVQREISLADARVMRNP